MNRAASLVLAFSLALAIALVAGGPARADGWTAPTATTSVNLEPKILRQLGFEISASGPAFATGVRFHSVAPSLLEFRAPNGDFERFDSGRLTHDRGFVLEGAAGTIRLDPLILQVSETGDGFDWLDAAGRRWFVLRDMHFTADFEAQQLRIQHVAIHIAPELATWLGFDELTDTFVGDASVVLPALIPPKLSGGSAAGPVCPFDTGPIDVALTGIEVVSQVALEEGVRVALAPNAVLENVGTGSVEWFEAIEGPVPSADPPGPHPFLSLSMFRVDPDGGVVQLGLGGVKHAFFTVNTACGCPPGHVLYAGCVDNYSVATNRDRTYLAPREEVSALTGAWARVGSHFDQCLSPSCNPATDDMDDFRHHLGETEHDDFEHRLVVPESELSVAGAEYFVSAWYLAAGDVDIFNSMGYRAVTPTLLANGVWTFPFADAGLNSGSLLDAVPHIDLRNVDTGQGHVQLHVRIDGIGPVGNHFEYALMNFDFDRKIDGFSVPVPMNSVVTNADSRGLGDDSANDWTVTVGPTSVSWQAPPGKELDWGMLQSFGFDVDRQPGLHQITASVQEPGSPASIGFQTFAAPEPRAARLAAVAALVLAALTATARAASPSGQRRAG